MAAKKSWRIDRVPMTNNERESVPHWGVLRRDSRAWKLLIRSECGLGPGKKTLEKYPPARLKLKVTRSRRQDREDNFRGSLKPVLDGLVSNGWLRDDSERWLELEAAEVGTRDKSKWGVEIGWELPERR